MNCNFCLYLPLWHKYLYPQSHKNIFVTTENPHNTKNGGGSFDIKRILQLGVNNKNFNSKLIYIIIFNKTVNQYKI